MYKLVDGKKIIFSEEEEKEFTKRQQNNQKVNIEKLRQNKLEELKAKREEYKKTIFIKEGYTLFDVEVGTNNYQNLIRGKFGWTKEDLEKYDEELKKVGDEYDKYKNNIKNETKIKNLENLIIDFEK